MIITAFLATEKRDRTRLTIWSSTDYLKKELPWEGTPSGSRGLGSNNLRIALHEADFQFICNVITPANNYINPVISEKLVLDLIGERESS